MKDKNTVTGAVLAGGHSSRFGTNKALYSTEGQPVWLVKAVRLLQPFCQQVWVSASETTASSYIDYVPGIEIVIDESPDQGPMGGILSLLRKCSTDWLLILPCDMPYINADILTKMLSTSGENTDAVTWTNKDGRMSFPLLLHHRTEEFVVQQLKSGNRRMKSFLEAIHTEYLSISDIEVFRNINSHNDL